MKLVVILIETLFFSYIILLLLVRVYYLLLSGLYSKKIKKVAHPSLYYLLLFIPILGYKLFSHSQRNGTDFIQIPLKNGYYIESNEVGTKLYKDNHIYNELQNFSPFKYGIDNDLLYGHFIANNDTARFLLNLRSNHIIQFYSDEEYQTYCRKNSLPIIKNKSVKQNYDDYYYWYFKPSIFILLILFMGLIIWLRKKEKMVLYSE